MEKPPLEKVIERLEKLDARQWERDGNRFNAKHGGLFIHLHVYKDMGMLNCHIEIINEGDDNEFCYEAKNRAEKNIIKSFYDKTCKKYHEFKEKEFEDKVKTFLSD